MSLRIGDMAPDFAQESSEGTVNFHEWAGDNWVVLYSHPADFTPVCTTELGSTSHLKPEFDKRGVKLIVVSVDSVEDHREWIKDINETQNTNVTFPILADADHKVSSLYDMIHPNAGDASTVRSVFIIDPDKKIRTMITYPKSTGRNFREVLRVIDSLQLTDGASVVTPADWEPGDDVIVAPSITDPDVLAEKFPRGYTELRPYLRMTPDPQHEPESR
ncbi:MAG: peroxiredoxin [Halofilum sp. (in: g-proteobacteria)]|nr:peroxiredoxin [Halofilum sp. (in: g-proteobacteria)]